MVRTATTFSILFACAIVFTTGTFGKVLVDDQSKSRNVPDSLRRYPFRSAIIELEYGEAAPAGK